MRHHLHPIGNMRFNSIKMQFIYQYFVYKALNLGINRGSRGRSHC